MRYLALLALLLAGGCSSDYTGRCKKIINHTVEVGVREAIVDMTEDEEKEFVAEVNSRREEALEKCEDAEPTQKDADCALQGTTLAEINSCTWFTKANMGGVR